MVVLTAIRVQVPTTNIDQSSILTYYKRVSGLGLENVEGTWLDIYDSNNKWVNDNVRPMYAYANYTGFDS